MSYEFPLEEWITNKDKKIIREEPRSVIDERRIFFWFRDEYSNSVLFLERNPDILKQSDPKGALQGTQNHN